MQVVPSENIRIISQGKVPIGPGKKAQGMMVIVTVPTPDGKGTQKQTRFIVPQTTRPNGTPAYSHKGSNNTGYLVQGYPIAKELPKVKVPTADELEAEVSQAEATATDLITQMKAGVKPSALGIVMAATAAITP